MASESYGVRKSVPTIFSAESTVNACQGRYLPVFAAQVYDQNAKMAKAGFTPINLQSIMIGVLEFCFRYD